MTKAGFSKKAQIGLSSKTRWKNTKSRWQTY